MITDSPGSGSSKLMSLGALLAASAIAAGAFGAHALKSVLTPADLAVFHTAAHYHLLQGMAVTFWGFVAAQSDGLARKRMSQATILLALSTLIFCATLYALVLFNLRWLGAITPIGGAGMIASWSWLAWLSFGQLRLRSESR